MIYYTGVVFNQKPAYNYTLGLNYTPSICHIFVTWSVATTSHGNQNIAAHFL